MAKQRGGGWCRRTNVAKDENESFEISESKKTAIYQHYRAIEGKEVSQHAKASCETCETSETVLISMLQKELDLKNKQLAVKDKQIEELNARLAESSAALVAAQQTAQAGPALLAGTIQKQLGGEIEGGQQRPEARQQRGRCKTMFRGEGGLINRNLLKAREKL